jgi:glutathione S-transferase
VLDQSLDIMRWALSMNDAQGWMREGEQATVDALIALNDGPFKQALDRYKYAPRHPERPAAAYRDEAVDLLLAPLEGRLQAHRFLLRDTPSLADMAILPFVRQFAAVDAAWFAGAPLPRLRDWMAGLTASRLFDAAMAKVEAWRPGDADVLF